MSEEEKKILKIFSEEVKKEQKEYEQVNEYTKFLYNVHKIVLNLINKQQKEIEKLKKKKQDVMNYIEYYLVGNYRLERAEERDTELRKIIKMLEE